MTLQVLITLMNCIKSLSNYIKQLKQECEEYKLRLEDESN